MTWHRWSELPRPRPDWIDVKRNARLSAKGDAMHGHDGGQPCGLNCPVGGADGTVRQTTIDGITLCTNEPFTDEEVAVLREYFAQLAAK